MKKGKLQNIIDFYKNNKKVVENYLFMTFLQVLSSLFYILIYPFLINTLGTESYGLYVFATSIVTYFVTFVGYGFDFPAVRAIAENSTDLISKKHTLSCVFTAKVYLEVISIFVFVVIVYSIPYLRGNWNIFYICFLQTLSGILFPQWYFQGVQRMKIVTYIQLTFKIFSLPFIFLLVHDPGDLWIFVLITSLVNFFGALTAAFIVRYHEKVSIKFMRFSEVLKWYKDATPFFLSASTSIIKEQSIAVIIGVFFGMKDVAIYDLANKIILLPRILLVSINGALFPKIIANVKIKQIKKIINYEIIIGLIVILFVAIFGKWVVLFMSNVTMLKAYPLSIILSITVLVWLVVGSYISFIFIPQNRYSYVTKNQIVALLSFILYCSIGFAISRNIYVLVIAISLSGLTEIAYCNYIIWKKKLLFEQVNAL